MYLKQWTYYPCIHDTYSPVDIHKQTFIITYQDIHNINTGSNPKFRIPSTDLTKFQKAVYYSGIKIFNHVISCKEVYLMLQNFSETLQNISVIATLLILYKNILSFNVIHNLMLHKFVLLGLSLILYKMELIITLFLCIVSYDSVVVI
jgi:hypothetical protein